MDLDGRPAENPSDVNHSEYYKENFNTELELIRYSCMMLHPSSIRFITFIVLRRRISKKRVKAVDMRGNKDQSECLEIEVMTIEIIFVSVPVYAAASVATFKRLIYNFDNQL
ncbi:hypothetical protein T09_877 [Trichinella sp. T9]|nr:hypothetical protein T09_877 [Trichinella sp. T9]